ncbi:MAG TPA: urease accessory protein UreD [Trichocoleus sp.]
MSKPAKIGKANPTHMIADPISPSLSFQPWQGSVHLLYTVRQGKTLPQRSYAQAPLKLQRPLYPEGEEICHSILVHTAGGMAAGDSLETTVGMEPGSRALVTTAAANKIYRSTGETAQQITHLSLSPSTCLEWFPQETIVFSGAQFHQQTRVDLAPGAIWVGWDITRFGRSARGETLQQGHWRSHLEVWQSGIPLWCDRQFLQGGSDVLTSPHGLNGHPVIATLALLGWNPTADHLEAIRALWHSSGGEVGVTRLQQGLLCRYRGPSSQLARRWFGAVWEQLRPDYLNRPACFPRAWAI